MIAWPAAPYVAWARPRPAPRYDLAASDLLPVTALEWPAMLDSDAAADPAALDVALSAAIAAHCGVPAEPEMIAAAITPRTRLVVLTRPHNPTGAVIDGPTLAAIAETAERARIHVLVGEVYLDTLAAALDAATHLEIARRCPARSAAH